MFFPRMSSFCFFFSSRRRHTRCSRDWSSDVCSSDLSTIGRLSSSIVHDLRNPLAAIYGGAEMLVDSELAPPQTKRLAANIYRASRRIQELLADLVNVSRGHSRSAEICKLGEVVQAACDASAAAAEAQEVRI